MRPVCVCVCVCFCVCEYVRAVKQPFSPPPHTHMHFDVVEGWVVGVSVCGCEEQPQSAIYGMRRSITRFHYIYICVCVP